MRSWTWAMLACGGPAGDTGDTGDTGVDVAPCPDGVGGVDTTTGCVVGTTWAGGGAWLGIPYAEPPVGPLRWERTVPIAPWDEPLAADAFGPACPQSSGTFDESLGPGDGDEDCLTLNVLAPDGASDLPVLFFTHGGGHTDGSGSQPVFVDDPDLARGAVVVTHNYRLGPLGFLAHPDLPDGGNQGLWDTLTALRWTRDNAAAFGGDPDRILIFGESAGALTTCALWLSPEADGLFAAALGQSAPCQALATPESTAATQATAVQDALGCVDLDCMRAATTQQVLEALPARQGFLGEGEGYGPYVDGALLPAPAIDLLDGDRAPFAAGVNSNEGILFTLAIPIPGQVAYDAYVEAYASVSGFDPDALKAMYDPDVYGGHHEAVTALVGDHAFVCPTRAWLRETAIHGEARGYWFDRVNPWLAEFGAFHGVELAYVFGTLDSWYATEDEALAATMQAAWTGLPHDAAWPPIGDGWLAFGQDGQAALIDDVRTVECDLYDEVAGL